MTDQRTELRAASPDDELVFHDYHRPRLPADDYRLTVQQTLTTRRDESIHGLGTIHLRVSGPQVTLPTGSVVSTFPADTASGRFFTTLPHVTLARGVLPWEREPDPDADTIMPWMVLLVLDATEFAAADVRTMKAEELPAEIPHRDTDPDQDVAVLEVASSLLASHFPTPADLPWTAHVRSVDPVGATPRPETATVLSARLAVPDSRNHAFLLSVEHRYGSGGIESSGATAVFPILHQWSFSCEAEHRHGFVELLTTTDGTPNRPAPFTLGAAPADAPESAGRIAAGFVPLRHELRNGDTSAAWYHGPLVPSPLPMHLTGLEDRLPADQSDDLLLVDDDFAMFDVSYAAAWELGRTVMLEHADIATTTYQWKRAFSHVVHQRERTPTVSTAPGAVVPEPPRPPEHVGDWIRTGLFELREIPWRYLVPDEAMLPPSSFRFFDVDPLWLDCLRDGAVSAGRTDSRAREIELEMRRHLAPPPSMTGFLLRSGAVSDFPGLEVDGYADTPAEPFGGRALTIRRIERLSPSVLLVIFDGVVRTVDIHLHPQAIHFGFSLGDGSTPKRELFEKRPSGHGGGLTVQLGYLRPNDRSPVGINTSRRVDLAWLAAELGLPTVRRDGDVGQFARMMLEGVPLVRFEREVGTP